MKIDHASDIESFFENYHNFGEWIIEEMKLSDYGTTFEVSLSCGRASQEEGKTIQTNRVILSFRLVQELHINNALNAAMLSSPQSLNWGMNEVSFVKLLDSSVPWPRPFESRYFHRVDFLWEGQRSIGVVFCELHVVDVQNS